MQQKLGYWQQTYVDHLRARYRKTTGQLGRSDEKGNCSYCALGLMAEIAYQNGVGVFENFYGGFYYDNCHKNLSDQVKDLFGLRDAVGTFRSKILGMKSLASLNDLTNTTFTELADLIEKNPANFFVRST